MALNRVQHVRFNQTTVDAFVPLSGELVIDITNNDIRLGDGVTPGGHVIGNVTNLGGLFQPLDDSLTNFLALVGGNNQLPFFIGADEWSQTSFTAFARTLVGAADATEARAILEALNEADDITFTGAIVFDGTVTFNGAVNLDAIDVDYDNTSSGLAALDVQAALDEIDATVDIQGLATGVSYDNTTSGLAATDVQAAIDEADAKSDAADVAQDIAQAAIDAAQDVRLDNLDEDFGIGLLQTLLPANIAYQACAIWHASMDDHPEWYAAVEGLRSTCMAVLVNDLGGVNTTLDVYDMTVSPAVLLQTETVAGTAVRDVSILGGIIAVTGANDFGVQTWGWTKTGFRKLQVYNTLTNGPQEMPSANMTKGQLGYSNQPRLNPNTQAAMPSIAYATGGFVGVIKDDGNNFHDPAGTGYTLVSWMFGRILSFRSGVNDCRISKDVALIISDSGADWNQGDLCSDAGSNPALDLVSDGGGFVEIKQTARSRGYAIASDRGVNILRVSQVEGNAVSDNNATGLSAYMSGTVFTGWRPYNTRACWFTDATGELTDRSSYGNDLTKVGTPAYVISTGSTTDTRRATNFGNSFNAYYTRPFEASFDPGIGSFTVMSWFRSASTTQSQYMCNREGGGIRTFLMLMTGTGTLHFSIIDGGGVGDTATSPDDYDDGIWHMFVCRKVAANGAAPGRLEIWADGELVATTTIVNSTGTLDAPASTLTIGVNVAVSVSANTLNISMIRYAISEVTVDEIRFMYESERLLFVPNSKATLAGGNDDVKDVSFDPLNGDLWVAEGEGITRFRYGLLREEFRPTAGDLWTGAGVALDVSAEAFVLATDADAYAEVPERQSDRKARELAISGSAPLSAADLGPAKGWVSYDRTNQVILESFNVQKVDTVGVGQWRVFWAIPFATTVHVNIGSYVNAAAGQPILQINDVNTTHTTVTQLTAAQGGGESNAGAGQLVAFGQLENE